MSCTKEPGAIRSFCCWTRSIVIDEEQDTLLAHLGVSHLYTRFFDVDWNPYAGMALPVATVRDFEPGSGSRDITPSIFITNAVLRNSGAAQLDTLAENIGKRTDELIAKFAEARAGAAGDRYYYSDTIAADMRTVLRDSAAMAENAKFRAMIKDILIDCDWTEGTRDKYFYLISRLKEQFRDYRLSATVRLWQFRHREKAGTPPVDRALLMCYNMESPKEYKVDNSICSVDELSKYIREPDYPVHLDIALPIFHWAVLFRGGQYKGILSGISAQDCLADSAAFIRTGDNRFSFRNDTIIGDSFIRSGDQIRIERVSPEELAKVAALLHSKLDRAHNSRISFFSLDREFIDSYGTANIKKYYSILER